MKFADALMSNKLLKAATLAEATRPQFTDGRLRLRIPARPPDEVRTYGHGGGARNERDPSRVSGIAPVGDRAVQPGPPSASRMGDWLHVRMPLKETSPVNASSEQSN
jgi:hypothetical protein